MFKSLFFGMIPVVCSTLLLSATDGHAKVPSEVRLRGARVPNPDYAVYGDPIFQAGTAAWIFDRKPQLFYTGDSGRTWTRYRMADGLLEPRRFAPFGPITITSSASPLFVSPAIGFLTSQNGTWRTSDGARSWRRVLRRGYEVIGFSDRSHGWLATVRQRPGIHFYDNHITHDGGVTWHDCHTPMPVAPWSVFFLDQKTGWMVAQGFRIATPDEEERQWSEVKYTNDGGCHWRILGQPMEQSYFDALMFSDRLHGWMIEYKLHVLFGTTDGGKSWQRLNSGDRLVFVDFADSNHGLALDLDNVLYSTPNAGRYWKRLNEKEIASLCTDLGPAPVSRRWTIGGYVCMLWRAKKWPLP